MMTVLDVEFLMQTKLFRQLMSIQLSDCKPELDYADSNISLIHLHISFDQGLEMLFVDDKMF